MFNSQLTSKQLCTSFATFLLIALTARCHAGFMKVTGGFDTVTKPGVWTPIAVELENTGSGTIEGALDVEQGDSAIPVCTAAVYLPANSRKLYHVYARLREYGDVRVLFAGNRFQSVQKVPLNLVGLSDVTVISVGGRASQLSFLNREELAAYSRTGTKKSVYVGSIPVPQLPDRPAGYEGVDVLIISNLATSSANPRSLKALGMWVASGGTLVIATGADYRSYQNEFFDELLPVRITGAGRISTFKSLVGMGGAAFPAGAMAIAKSAPKAGIATKVISESGAPIVAEREYGAGRVVFLAFDHLSSPFKDWNGQTAFWKGIVSSDTRDLMVKAQGLTASTRDRYRSQYEMDSAAAGAFSRVVQQNPSIKMPSFSTIALFLLGYIVVLVPINYFVLHKMRRRELAWVTTPAIVLLFTVGAYFIGYTMKGGRLQLNEATFIEASCNSRYARAVTEASIFSPASRNYNVTLSDPQSLGQAIPAMDDPNLPAMRIGEQLVMEGLRMAMWSSKLLEATSGVDLGGHMRSDLKFTGNKAHGTIQNNTNVNLTDCVLVWNTRSIRIGQLARGHGAAVDFDFSSAPSALLRPKEIGNQKAMMMAFACAAASGQGRPILIAASSDRKRFDLAGQRPQAESSTCYGFRLDYSIGNEFALGPEAIPGKVLSASRQYGQAPDASRGPGVRVSLYPNDRITISYRLPITGSMEITDLKVTSAVSRHGPPGMPSVPGGGKATILVFNYSDGQWVSVRPGNSLQRPGQYASPRGEIRVQIRSAGDMFDSWIGISAKGRRK